MITHPGVYCLRTNVQDWDEETLWRTYTSLTDVEAVFRSLKSELGLRPIFHRTQGRSDGHLFITVIAYQMVQTIRRRLGEKGERELGQPASHPRRPAAGHRASENTGTATSPDRHNPSHTNARANQTWVVTQYFQFPIMNDFQSLRELSEPLGGTLRP